MPNIIEISCKAALKPGFQLIFIVSRLIHRPVP